MVRGVIHIENDLLAELYCKYQRQLYLFIYALCRNRDITDDIVQETFSRAILSLPDHHPNFIAWLYTVGKNLCFSQMKKQRRTLSLEEPCIPVKFLFRARESPEETVVSNEEVARLYAAILELPDKMRAVITLHYFCGRSMNQVAGILSLTPENVRVLASRGRQSLRKMLSEGDDFYGSE